MLQIYNKEDTRMSMWWHKKAEELLKGQTILSVKWQRWDPDDSDYGTGLIFETENNVFFVASDDEGNGPGALHYVYKEAEVAKVVSGVLPVDVKEV
jgi:hypothetical protein